jgi:Ser/Thr protein kinase RdoA (MazF antagonist)
MGVCKLHATNITIRPRTEDDIVDIKMVSNAIDFDDAGTSDRM